METERLIKKALVSKEILTAALILGISEEVLEEFISKITVYNAIMDNIFTKHLDPCIIQELMHSMYQKEYPEGCDIMGLKQIGKNVFVVEEGKFEIEETEKIGSFLGVTGKLYGEEAFLMSTKKLKSMKAITKCKVWLLDRKAFKIIMKTTLENKRNMEMLRSCPVFRNTEEESLLKISDAIVIEYFGTYEEVQMKANTLYIISNGSVKIVQTESEEKGKVLRVLNRSDHFKGELESNLKMIAFYPGVELLTFDMDSLNQLMGRSENFDQEDESKNKDIKKYQDYYSNIKLEELERVAILGQGNFGRVHLVRYSKDPNRPFALKQLEKHRTVRILQESHVISEREILMKFEHPFIIRLYRTFRDNKYIYMLFEACLGGQVWEVLYRNRFFDNETGRFIAASAIEALEYLHKNHVVYRDLKADNMVIDQYGYVKLVDFGLSKHLGFTGRTWSFCGTPHNMAPEIILNVGHDRAVDYWTLGLLIYELLCGCTIFPDDNPMRAYRQIMDGIGKIKFSYRILGRPAEDLVKKLCTRNPIERLGYGRIEDIKEHSWFEGFDWKGLVSRTMMPPKCLIPTLKNSYDTSYIDPFEVLVDPTYTPAEEVTNWDYIFE